MPAIDPVFINADSEVCPRACATDKRRNRSLSSAIVCGAKMPPLVVYQDARNNWLSEGFRRYSALCAARMDKIECDVREGGKREATLNAAGSNRDNRTLLDELRCVQNVLRECPQWDEYAISDCVGVPVEFVRVVRGDSDTTVDPVAQSTPSPPRKRKQWEVLAEVAERLEKRNPQDSLDKITQILKDVNRIRMLLSEIMAGPLADELRVYLKGKCGVAEGRLSPVNKSGEFRETGHWGQLQLGVAEYSTQELDDFVSLVSLMKLFFRRERENQSGSGGS